MFSLSRLHRCKSDPKIAMVLNCGSSSVKYQLFENGVSIVRGGIDNIGKDSCCHRKVSHLGSSMAVLNRDYPRAIQEAIESVLTVRETISCVGHRVVHGGPILTRPTLIDQSTLEQIRQCCKLAPLHNPSNIFGIELVKKILPSVPQIASFDTAFHSTIQSKAFTYAIPRAIADKESVRRYGFHGLSYAYVSEIIPEKRLVVAHLGSGCSASAIVNGRSIDTTMGFTPMEGLVMSTRAGSIDPGIVLHLVRNHGVDKASDILNKQSGLLGLSGLSGDMKELLDIEKKGTSEDSRQAHHAIEVFVYSVQKNLSQLFAALEYKVDAVVFTGGIGENSPEIRSRVMKAFSNLGLIIDNNLNSNPPESGLIAHKESSSKIYAVKTNEEKQIAREAVEVLRSLVS
jgi:acetate kinase